MRQDQPPSSTVFFQIPSTKVFLKTVNKKTLFFPTLSFVSCCPIKKTKNMSELYMSVLIGTCSSIFHRVIPLDSHKTKGWQITSFSQQIPTLTIFHRMHFCHWSHPKSGAPIKKNVCFPWVIYVIYICKPLFFMGLTKKINGGLETSWSHGTRWFFPRNPCNPLAALWDSRTVDLHISLVRHHG